MRFPDALYLLFHSRACVWKGVRVELAHKTAVDALAGCFNEKSGRRPTSCRVATYQFSLSVLHVALPKRTAGERGGKV